MVTQVRVCAYGHEDLLRVQFGAALKESYRVLNPGGCLVIGL